MSIPNYVQPTVDFSQGYTVQPSDWNSNIDGITSYFNGTVAPAINALQTSINSQNAILCNARLTTVTGQPYADSGTSGSANLYITAVGGNSISTSNSAGTLWTPYQFTSDIVIPAPSSVAGLYDVYVYWNGSSLVGVLSPYQTVTATNSPFVSYGEVLYVSDTSYISRGDVVAVGINNGSWEDCCVTAVNTNTSITVDWIGYAGYATPTIFTRTPVVPLAYVSGIPVMSTDYTKRFLGTVGISQSMFVDCPSGSVGSNAPTRYVANYYNRITKNWIAVNSTSGLTLNNATCIPAAGTGTSAPAKTSAVGHFCFVTTPQGTLLTVNRNEGFTSEQCLIGQSISGVCSIPNVSGGVTAYGTLTYNTPPFQASIWQLNTETAGGSFTFMVSGAGRQYSNDYMQNTSGTNATVTRASGTIFANAYTTGTVVC